MAGVLDFVFGKKALKTAAGETTATPKPTQPAGIDMAAEAKKTVSSKIGTGIKDYAKDRISTQQKKNRNTLPGRLATQFMQQ